MLEAAKDIWEGYVKHPFVLGLADGSLAVEKFRFYLLQDYLYLFDYAKVFAQGVVKAREPDAMRAFASYVDNILNGEMDIHKGYMARLGISKEQAERVRPSLKNQSYTAYMRAVAAEEGPAEIMAAVLSCAISYEHIAKWIVAHYPDAEKHDFYGEWVRVWPTLFLTMITCIILGMGVPTTANYIIMATTCAPILVNGMGMNLIAANMFVFYFGIVADITPPVALAAYAGSAIAKSNPMKTGVNASRLAIAAFIVPYIFAFNNAMLFIDTTPLQVLQIIVTSMVGMLGLAIGLEGFMMARMNMLERLAAIAAGLMLIYPGLLTDAAGLGVIAVIFLLQLRAKRALEDA